MATYENGYGYGGGWGGCCDVIVLLLFFAMMGGNGGFGGWGGNNTAAQTAALVQQDNLRSLAANTNATANWTQQLTGGLVQAAERIGDKVDRNLANTQQQFGRLDTNLCQVTNNLTQQINGVNTNINEKFCLTNQHIDGAKDQILARLTENEISALKQQNADLKGLLAVQQANCARESDTRTILAAIAQNGQARGGCDFGTPYGFGCNTNYQNAVLSNLTQMTQSLTSIAQTQQAQGTTLAAIQTRVNQIPTTAAAA